MTIRTFGAGAAAPLRAALIGLATVACAVGSEPAFPAGAVPLELPPPYRLWWAIAEQCSGVTAPFESVRWYHVPEAQAVEMNGETHQGFWFAEGNRIVLAGGSVLRGPLVRHEMLHALLNVSGHPATQFTGRCAGFVACEGECLADGGAAVLPGPGAPVLSPRDLLLSAKVVPSVSSLVADDGWTALVIEVRNPRSVAVWAQLDPVEPGHPASPTFGWAVGDGEEGYAFVWDTLLAFGAGETQRLVQDVRLPAGGHKVHALFNADTIAILPVRVSP